MKVMQRIGKFTSYSYWKIVVLMILLLFSCLIIWFYEGVRAKKRKIEI